jgi:hypothetical protein
MSLQKDVFELENYLKKVKLAKNQLFSNPFSLAILSSHFLAGTFTDQLLKDQGFNVMTIDFEAVNNLKNVTIDNFIEKQMKLIQNQCANLTYPIVHWKNFSVSKHDYYKNEKVTEWLKKGFKISSQLIYVHNDDEVYDSNGDNYEFKPAFLVPIVISGNRISIDNRQMVNYCYVVDSLNLSECVNLHLINDALQDQKAQHLEKLQIFFDAEKISPNISKNLF